MEGIERQIIASRADVKPEPVDTAPIKIEMLFGERFRILEDKGEWVRGVTVLGDYEGFVRSSFLGEPYEPTHRVSARAAVCYDERNFKYPSSSEPLYLNSLVTKEEQKETPEGVMHKIKGGGWIFESQLSPVGEKAPDFLIECLKFLGTSYGYERRGALIDCSTLVQAGCIAAGISCPYDVKSGEMEKLGESVPLTSDFSNLRRGDLIFWTKDKGSHVVIMVDETNCLHATIADPYRKALIQPLTDVAIDQERDGNGPITAVRRFPDYTPT